MAANMNQLPLDVAGVPGVVRPQDDLAALIPPEESEAPPIEGGMNLQEQDDGSVLIVDDDEDVERDSEFGENMAEVLTDDYLTSLGFDLCQDIGSDKKVREERDKQYAEGIKRTGLGNEAPGGAAFDGASKVVHPMLAKGCVDFASRAIKEMFPAGGPCKTQIIGEVSDSKLDRAERKKQFMNWQLTTKVGENRAELERLLSQLPLGGSQYKRWWWDYELGRPRTETVYIDDVFLPYNQADFYTATRIAHRQYIDRRTYDSRITQGLYCDLGLTEPSNATQDQSAAKAATDKVEGSHEDSSAYNDEGLREIYMTYVFLSCDEDTYSGGKSAPYIVHVDKWSEKVLGMFRNWDEADERMGKLHWMVEYNFIPWRGAYGVGLAHLIGSLAASGTGAVRAILDAAHIQNFPGGLKLKGGRNTGQSVQVNATELAEITAPPGIDDIRKVVMPFPFNGPSSVLFNLLEWLTQQAESVVSTASERIADGGGSDMPVGTALALIEHDSTNFSSIHARMHDSMKKELAILHRLNAENLSDREVVEELGELVVTRDDFEGPVDIIPVSDPNIFSEAQRFAQMQAVLQISGNQQFQQFFRADRLVSRLLKLLQVPSPEDIANLPKDPRKLGPLEENVAVSKDEPDTLKVYEEQDDLMHLQTHVHYMTSPIFGGSQLIGSQALAPLVQHCKEHMLQLYTKHTKAATDSILTISKMQGLEVSREDAEGRGAAFADAVLAQVLGPMVIPGLQQAMQLAQQYQQKPPPSPDVAAHEQGETQRLQMKLAADDKNTQAETQANQAASQLAAQMEAAQQATDERIAQLTAQLDLIRQDRDNQNKVLLAEMAGQNEASLERLKTSLQMAMQTLPDYSPQIMALDERTGQITQALGEQIAQLKAQHDHDKQAIVGLLHQLQQTISTPFWRRST